MRGKGVRRRLAIVRAIAVLSCPVLLSGCIFGLFPIGRLPATSPPPVPTFAPGPSQEPEADIPDLPIVDLPGAPAFAVWSPERNAQIRISTWRSGSVTDDLVVPLLNQDPVYLDHVRVAFAPTGRFFALVEAADGPTITRAFVRIFSSTGELLWTGPPDIAAHATVRWSSDGTRLAIDAVQRWLVVTPGEPGGAALVEIDARRPRGAADPYAYPWQLLDFSEDGATLFGSRSAGLLQYTLPLARVASSGGPIEPIASLPVKAGLRMAPLRSLLDSPLGAPIDPRTGRIAFATGIDETHVAITLRSGKEERHLPLDLPPSVGIGMVWLEGSLLVWHRNPAGDQLVVSLVPTGGKDTGKERRVTSFPVTPLRGPGLVAVTPGYAVFSFGRGLPEVRNRLLLVRLTDGLGTAIDSDGSTATSETYGFGGWLPLR
jgi:hypothetical protein